MEKQLLELFSLSSHLKEGDFHPLTPAQFKNNLART